jgi:hypothetical protein
VPLSFKELGDVVESLHAGQANQSPTHSVVRNGSSSALLTGFTSWSVAPPEAAIDMFVRQNLPT